MVKKVASGVTGTGIAVALAVIVALGFLFLGPSLFAPLEPAPLEEATVPALSPSDTSGEHSMITDTVVGTGAEAVIGKKVTVNYVGMFEDGTVFDASERAGRPFTFTLGVDSVIQGWQQGLVGMKVGGKRHLVIPPELGYGPNDYGPIPGGSTLIFDVELLSVE
jgi:FKBP-type peptidyl-prolyl cis-trans isomerase